MTKTFELIADYLQLDTRGLDAYDLAVPGPIMQEVAQYLASLSGKAVVIVVSVQPAGVQLEIIGDQLERFRHVPALAVKIKRVGVVLNRWPFIKPEH